MSVAITGSPFTGRKLLAEGLSQALGYRRFDDQVVVEKATAFGGSHSDLQDLLRRPPTVWNVLGSRLGRSVDLLRAALLDELKSCQVVYHGDLGNLLLKETGAFLRIRVEAPNVYRATLVRERLGYRREEALAHIQKLEEARDGWLRYLYKRDWADPSLYDVVINLAHLKVDEACALLRPMLVQRNQSGTSYFRQEALDDLALSTRLKAALSLDQVTKSLRLRVQARGGAVTVSGKVGDSSQFGRIKAIAARIPEVGELNISRLQLSGRGILHHTLGGVCRNVCALVKGTLGPPAWTAAGLMFLALFLPFTDWKVDGVRRDSATHKVSASPSSGGYEFQLSSFAQGHCDSQASHQEPIC